MRFGGTLVSIIGLNTPSNAQIVKPGSTLGCVSEVNTREWRITGMIQRVSLLCSTGTTCLFKKVTRANYQYYQCVVVAEPGILPVSTWKDLCPPYILISWGEVTLRHSGDFNA